MKIKFWGVRGSIPSPGPKTVRYGGNTTCIEVRTDEGDLIVLDAGSGIVPLAYTLFPELPLTCHIFISHTHWDHIQGLPFFIPSYIPGNTLRIHGPFDPVGRRDIHDTLSRQMEYSFFPVRMAEFKASFEYITLKEHDTIKIGSATVDNILMNHPVISFGYRITSNGKSIFFTGDHEQPYNIYEPEDAEYSEYGLYMEQKNQAIMEFMRGCDLLIADCSYTPADYPAKKGWGHSTFDENIKMAKQAGVKTLFFTHHEPTRSDDLLEKVFQEALERNPRQPGDPEYLLAKEGLVFEV